MNFLLQGIGGNIMTGSPISDLNPLLMAASAKLTFCSQGQCGWSNSNLDVTKGVLKKKKNALRRSQGKRHGIDQ